MPHLIEFHPSAIDEARAARLWYESRSELVSRRFMDALDQGIEKLSETPQRFPVYRFGTRRYLLRGFPFILYYREMSDRVQVIAVAHAKRKPGYWRDRT